MDPSFWSGLCVFRAHHNAPFYAEGSWIDRIDKTWLFNPGCQIGQRPTSIVFDLETMTAEWFSLEGECLKRLLIESGEVSAPVPPLSVHEHFQNLVHHTKMVVAFELLPDIDQIFVQRIEAPREKFGDVHGDDGMVLQELPAVFTT